jgi:predicted phage terminase large subunit-like protein
MNTHSITEDVEVREIVLDGSTTCPRPQWCDQRDGEEYEDYVRRHAGEHGMDFPSQTAIEDIERNLSLWCLYYAHKYLIGNRTLTPYPFWETHEFVANWNFHPDDLEMGLWEEEDPVVASEFTDSTGKRRKITYELKPADERLPGVYKRFKEVELPRGCQKTSTVSKAYVTWSHLRQRFIFDNIYHRIIITSATTTLTEGVTGALKSLWEKNQRIKKLFGINRYRTIRNQTGDRQVFKGRDGIYGSKGKNTVNLRWMKDADDATGLTAFSVMYAGIKSETQGSRADEYIFDDGSTKKNSKNDALREAVVACFEEQFNQLDPMGQLMVCNTRQHLYDFGGKIKSPEYRGMFHILHRRARYVDTNSGTEKAYYPVDGLGRERYTLKWLDDAALLKPESEMWAEYMNCPFDPAKKMFSRDQFQIIDLDDRVPMEVRYGLGRALSQTERVDLERAKRNIVAYNTCDPAGKEQQSIKGDSTWIVGSRFDQFGNWWITYLAYGQWDSDETWNQNYIAWLYNRPAAADYELPASELHVRGSFEQWKANKAQELGFPITMMMDFFPMPKSGKPARIEALSPWTKNRRIFILSTIAKNVRDEFLSQIHEYPQGKHDDGPDALARTLRFVSAPSLEQVKLAMAQKEGPRIVDGKMQVSTSQFMEAFKSQGSGAKPNWGLRGRRKIA